MRSGGAPRTAVHDAELSVLALWVGRRGNRLCSGSGHAAEVDEPSRRLFTRTSTQCCEPAPHEVDAGFRRYLHRSSPVISGFSSSPSVSTKPHGRRDEPAPDGSTEHGVLASWAGNAHRVVSSSERRRPRRACHWPLSADRSGQQVVACTGWHPPLGGVGRDDTGARDCEGRRCGYHPVAYRRTCRVAERGHP